MNNSRYILKYEAVEMSCLKVSKEESEKATIRGEKLFQN